MENLKQEEEKLLPIKTKESTFSSPGFWRWYFVKKPIFFLRFIVFSYFVQWFIWNVFTLVKKGNLEAIFFLQKTWEGAGGITLVFGPILGTIFILVTILPLVMMWAFYALSISKWEVKDPALRFWAGTGIILVPFFSTLFFKLLALILSGIGY
ncbi:MAG: hypothetical protein PHW15_03215 [Patescibacteria group bacterium]|nr:hypothetical protein [Patescibacteria group bacterium]